jgi:hypothetical protein
MAGGNNGFTRVGLFDVGKVALVSYVLIVRLFLLEVEREEVVFERWPAGN